MRQWKLMYELCNDFSQPVIEHYYSLRCFPQKRIHQKVSLCEYEITPAGKNSWSRDAFGNQILYGRFRKAHGRFRAQMEAVVFTDGLPEPEKKTYWQLGMYRSATKYTTMGEKLQEFLNELPKPEQNQTPWERTEILIQELWNHFSYVSGSTNVFTTAEEAFSQGCGVCQDYTHILLALCRSEGMTARYVAGAIPGEGQSHAWIEVWQDGFWKGFDPTNHRVVADDYICFACGRDAQDCGLNQGIFRGAASQAQSIFLKMETIEGENK